MNKSMVSQQILSTVMTCIVVDKTTLNHMQFVLYHNIKDKERNLC